MKYLKKFNSNNIYNKDLKSILPKSLSIIKGDKKLTYKQGNIMDNANMIQITYDNSGVWGEPETLEIDLYLIDHKTHSKITVDVTHGDEVVCSFYLIPPNKAINTLNTSIDSEFDPSKTVFAFDKTSIIGLVNFFNNLGFNYYLTENDFSFCHES
jgi:hypothetical protein